MPEHLLELAVDSWHGETRAFAAERGLTAVHIELDRAFRAEHLVVRETMTGGLADASARLGELAAALSPITYGGVSSRLFTTSTGDGPGDWEHRLAVALPDESVATILDLTDIAARHDARLWREDGVAGRVVVARHTRIGRAESHRRFTALLADLGAHDVLDARAWHVSRPQSLIGTHLRWHVPTGDRPRIPATSVAAGTPGVPATYLPIPGVEHRAVFDPALKQFPEAYRHGEPGFTDPDLAGRWRAHRRAALAHVLGLVATSDLADSLVLRGSAAMRAWFPETAREPGDLDFVVMPASREAGPELLDALREAVRANPGPGLDGSHAPMEDIWTYERAEGRRVVFPVRAEGLPESRVQVDVVFGENLPIPPEPLTVDGETLWAATAELSLAWKLQWLHTDMWPQGKDLYDAVLLAEHTTVDHGLVRDLLRPELGERADAWTPVSVLGLMPDWPNLRDEDPSVPGELDGWLRRLARALA
ncbi:nucleotidyl transferase AbiEii/AbiGii toxin family protein [Actinorhabdospora filicis]|uniref:nucleotidyl transferase AbiEii/AbiGii toxin family protein n=1 Tax=Actinorhabdospora filicis TaxID=1785913 RepID=UPI0025556320|nr:nucleotidyl transferase AbiEii/AbiGii toxin family protein [Actinorhabdospora filicis]